MTQELTIITPTELQQIESLNLSTQEKKEIIREYIRLDLDKRRELLDHFLKSGKFGDSKKS